MKSIMKWSLSMVVVLSLCIQGARGEDLAQKMLQYFPGKWSGQFDKERFVGRAVITKDGNTVQLKGNPPWADAASGWQLKVVGLYQKTKKANTLSLIYFDNNGSYMSGSGEIKLRGKVFTCKGNCTGINGDAKLMSYCLEWVVEDQSHITFKLTNQRLDGVPIPDLIAQWVRLPGK